jgi:hypothetical protein
VLSFPATSVLDSCFPHAMKMCTIQGSSKLHFFFFIFDFLLLKMLLKEIFFAKMAFSLGCSTKKIQAVILLRILLYE